MVLNFNPLSSGKEKGEFVTYQNKKTGKIDIIDYEIDRKVVLVLKEKGKWKTLKELKKYPYTKMINKKELETIIKRAQNVEGIRMASSPTILKSNFQL